MTGSVEEVGASALSTISRFLNNPNDLVSFMTIVVVVLAIYVLFLHVLYGRQVKALTETIMEIKATISALIEAVHHVSKN